MRPPPGDPPTRRCPSVARGTAGARSQAIDSGEDPCTNWCCSVTARASGTSRTCSPVGTTATSPRTASPRPLPASQMMTDAGVRARRRCTPRCRSAPSAPPNIALDGIGRLWIPVRRSWRLNERHYGDLTGKNKKETTDKYGEEKVKIWRRSYDVPPPPITADNAFNPNDDVRYADLPPELVPLSECLADVVDRMLPYWFDSIVPDLARRPVGAGRRPRQLTPGARQAPRRASPTTRSPSSTSRPACRCLRARRRPSARPKSKSVERALPARRPRRCRREGRGVAKQAAGG